MHTEAAIKSLLDAVVDPFIGISGQEMGLRYQIQEESNQLQVTIVAGFPVQLLAQNYCVLAKEALATIAPNRMITLYLKQAIRAHKTQLVGMGLRGVKNTIAVASGKGGVGKSTVTVNLAAALAQLGARVGILDADIYGPSIPMMLGSKGPVTIEDDSYQPIVAHQIHTMSIAYLTQMEHALIWRGPMLAKTLIQIFDYTHWDELDYLFIDLPPGTGDIQLTLVQKIPLTAALIVTTPQNVATLDAQKALTLFSKTGIDVLGIIENMATHQCSQCGHEEAIFGAGGADELSKKEHCPLLGQLPLNSAIRSASDDGIPLGGDINSATAKPFVKAAMNCAISLANKPVNYADKFPPVVIE